MARSFNSANNDFISLTGPNVGSGHDWSSFAWVNPNISPTGNHRAVISNRNATTSYEWGLENLTGIGQTTTWGMFFFNGTLDTTAANAIQIAVSAWAHVGVVGTSSGVTYYYNGAATAGGSFNAQTGTDSGTYNIGKDVNLPGENFPGSMADLAIWTVALTAGEALSLSKGARPGQIRNGSLKGWWPLTGIQSPEPDYSGANNDGTITGTANASGPPVMQFTPRWNQFNSVAAASFNPAWALGRNQFIEGFAS